MENGITKRLPYIDLMESIAIFFVMTYHCTISNGDFLRDGTFAVYATYVLRAILSVCVPLFFFANGYLLFNKAFDLKKHVVKTIRLAVLTCVWGLIQILCLRAVLHTPLTLREIADALWTWKQGWIDNLWFMGALVSLYVVFPLLKTAYDTRRSVFYYFVIACGILTFGNKLMNAGLLFGLDAILKKTNIVGFENGNLFNMFNPFRGVRGFVAVYFCLGGLAHGLVPRVLAVDRKKRDLLSAAGILLCTAAVGAWGVYRSRVTRELWDPVWFGYDSIPTLVNVLLIFVICLGYEDRGRKGDRFAAFISRNTLGIYFLHGVLVRASKPWILEKLPFARNLAGDLVYGAVILCVCCGLAYLLRRVPYARKLIE